jgi:hypothetical protein
VGRRPQQLAVGDDRGDAGLRRRVEPEAGDHPRRRTRGVAVGVEPVGQQQREQQAIGVLDVVGLDGLGLAGVEQAEALERGEAVAL